MKRPAGIAQARHVAVVGAGLSGLACAQALQAAGWRVTVFEKSRGPGGRMSTRQHAVGAAQRSCDHGAQYFTARDAGFRAEVERWLGAGVAALWEPRLAVFGDAAAHRREAGLQRFVGTPGMTAPAQWLAADLDLRTDTAVTGLQSAPEGWRLQLAQPGDGAAAFDAVLLALPAPQAAALLAPVAPVLQALAAGVRMRGCWALMLQYAQALDLPFDAAFVNQAPLRWIARNSAKPAREPGAEGGETWLLHAEAEWSEAQLDAPEDQVAAALLHAFTALGAPDPQAWTAHRWRYADSPAALQQGCAWDAELQLGLCGDWLQGGKVEGAWLSGRALAARVLG